MTIDADRQVTISSEIDPGLELGRGIYQPVAALFADWAGRDPDLVAVSWSGREYSYRQMWHWVAALADNVRSGQRVAVYGQRSPGTVAALWAVLSAGGVVVPLDDSLPLNRRRIMLEESGAELVMVAGGLDAEWVTRGEVVRISDCEPPSMVTGPAPRPIQSAGGYIFFTSGTTGIPRGIAGSAASLDQFISWMGETFEIGPGDRIAQTRSLSFDASLREVFLPLATGATMCIAPDPLDPEKALSWIQEEGITVFNATPTHAEIWLSARNEPAATVLRWVMFSGEMLDEALVGKWRNLVSPPGSIVNLYGPTETTMIRTYWIVPDDLEPGVQPVGFPIPHSQALVVDGNRMCRVGERGEVLLRTSYGTDGYINDPVGQARSFVTNPLTGDMTDVVYRTGDVGWYRDDGALVVSGRIDDQVQILGVRIEPDEVTAHLSAHPNVISALVVAERDLDPVALTAYLVPSTPAPSVADLRKYLADRVPGPAVPTRFEFLSEMPLTSNGKIDRARLTTATRLSTPGNATSRLGALSPAKRRLLEKRLADRAASQAADRPLPASAPELPAGIPLSSAQERLWFLDRLFPGRSNYNIPRVYRLRGPLDLPALQAAFDSIHARHEILRTTYRELDGVPYQWINAAGPAPVSVVDLTEMEVEQQLAEVSRLSDDAGRSSFDLAVGPIWHITVAVLSPVDHVLIMVVHHIAADGWSMPVLFDELRTLYRNRSTGQRNEILPVLTKQYGDYAREQRAQIAAGGYDEDLAYWERQLAGIPTVMPLPVDRPRPSPRDSSGEAHKFTAPNARVEDLENLVRSHRVTPFMVGLALFAGFLSRVTGSDDPVVGVPSADRPSTDLEGLIGFFVNSLPMRPGVPGGTTFRQLLDRVRETAIGAYNHRPAPFEHIVNRLQPARSADRSPIFQVFFQFGNAFPGQLELEGIEIEPVLRVRTTTKFDITLYLNVTDGVLGGRMVYASDIFDPASIDALCQGFAEFAAAALADPDRLLTALPIGEAPTVKGSQPSSALPRAVIQPQATDQGARSASTATIERMCEIWESLLGGTAVSPDDDFFARGGHSLLAVRIFSRIEREWGVELPLGALFDAATPRLLSALVDGARWAAAVATSVVPKRGLERAPLSFAQRRLWFLDLLAPGSSAYHIPWRVGLEGDLNEDALQAAFDTLLIRHAVLRTRIVADQGTPWQVVDPPVPVPIERHDLRDLEPAAATDRLTELITDHGRRPFDLAADLMIRVMLVRLADHRHVLSVVCHHVATDADSMRILRRELGAIYSSHLQGSEPNLPILPLEYADVAAWQVERFSDGEPGLAYWQARLAGELPVLDLVTDRIRPAEFTYSGGAETVSVPDHVTQRLLGLAGEHAATPVMSLLSAFAVLLYRHTLQEDLIVGIPLTERVLPGTENLVGFLVNSLPIRIEISPTGGFTELLDQVRRRVVEALDHGQVPFEAIVERVDPPRDPGRTPIYQAMFDLTHGGSDRWSLDGLESVPVGARTTRRIAKFDLRLHCMLRGGQLSATFEYRADLFLPPTITAMAGQFVRLLESIADHPAEPIDRLDMVPTDQAEITADEAVPVGHHLAGAFVSDIFDTVVARHPIAVAVETPTGKHTYREIAAMVEELALRLRETGVRPGDAVGIVLPRSLGVAVAMLAVLRAGASYVPLDPAFPAERIRTVCSDGNITVLIEAGGAQSEISVTRVEERRPLSDEMHNRVAYTMYTSGSTGAPKGVMIPHEAITRLVCNPNYVTIDVGDGVAFASNVAFDAATFEVFGALLNGGRLVIIEPDTLLSPPALVRALADRAVTTMFITTALFNAVISEQPDAFRSLRDLLFGGEQVDASMVRRCFLAGPPQRLVHVYGPTEATTFAAFHLVTSIPEAARTMPIGGPVAGTGLRVVDLHMHRVPAGAPGELLISGEGLALGYLGDPDLTSVRFVTIEGVRFYRTGDLVRKRPDGDIEFLGRLDRQMKLRGFRIEPAEIEARLVEHPSVADSVVVARSDRGQARLAAYVVRRSPESPTEAELRDHLRRTLPDFMVPDAITWIDRVPLNSNGKVDSGALPNPAWLFDSAISTDQAGSPDEERMSRLWRSALGRARVGPNDNFFSLGGHSLLAVKLFAEIEREYGVAMPLATLFQAPTVAALTRRVLSHLVEQELSGDLPKRDLPKRDLPKMDLVAIQPHGDRIPLFCVHSAGGTALEYEALARHLGTNQPLFALQAVGMEDNRRPHRTIEEMAMHYEELVRRQYPSGPYLLAGWSSGGVVAYEMARRLTAAGAKVELLALFDSGFPAEPPVRGPRKYWRIIRQPGRRAWRRLWIDVRHVLGNVRHGIPIVLDVWRRRPPSTRHRGWRFWRITKIAIESYAPPRYAGTIVFFRARDGGRSQSLAPGQWKTLAAAVEVFDVDGTHSGVTCLIREPQVASLATPLRNLLDEINSSGRNE